MKRSKERAEIELDAAEIPKLIEAIESCSLADRYKEIVLAMIHQMVEVSRHHRERMAKLRRIKAMLGRKTEKKRRPQEKTPGEKKPGHGRHGAADYPGAQEIYHAHPSLKAGDLCPECGQGPVYDKKPSRVIRLKGNPMVTAEAHQFQRLRCSACQKVFVAPQPWEPEEEKADSSARAMVAVCRYGLGLPHHRLAQMQAQLGIPLPASTQYEMVELLWTYTVPVYKELIVVAAGCFQLFVDDTTMNILELQADKEARKEAGERVGVFTTAIVARQPGLEIRLFFTGRNHAGENLARLLTLREKSLPPPIQMSDASSRNFPKDTLTIVALCLIHGRRNFVECEEVFPEEAKYVIERLGKVYHHEKHIRQRNLNDGERLAYHQKMSAKPMAEIHQYAKEQLESRKVEPNSVLGKAFTYLLKHWDGLTQFLRIPGAPLDNNVAERVIKGVIRHRRASLFYKTVNGAYVGDVLMSLIQTCQAVGVNPFEYLTALDRHHLQVAKNPRLWLPWTYKQTLNSLAAEPTVGVAA